MDWLAGKRAILEGLKKYGLAIVVLLAGILLLAFPSGENEKQTAAPAAQEVSLQESLEDILREIYGAGNVSVLLTQAVGEETIYQTDDNLSEEEGRNTSRRETVLISGAGREETGLIRKVKAPTYLGAVVVCQGADNAAVRLAIVEAVRSATGLTTDRISVLKMK